MCRIIAFTHCLVSQRDVRARVCRLRARARMVRDWSFMGGKTINNNNNNLLAFPYEQMALPIRMLGIV